MSRESILDSLTRPEASPVVGGALKTGIEARLWFERLRDAGTDPRIAEAALAELRDVAHDLRDHLAQIRPQVHRLCELSTLLESAPPAIRTQARTLRADLAEAASILNHLKGDR